MLKKIFLFLFISALTLSKEISIDDILKIVEYDPNATELKIYKNLLETNGVFINANKLGDFNGVSFSSNLELTQNINENKDRNYDRTIRNKIGFGPFFVNFNQRQHQNSYISYGIEKNLKNVFYSENNLKLRKNLIKKSEIDINFKKSIVEKKIEVLNFYKDVLNLQNEMLIRENAYKHYMEAYKKLKVSYNLGASSKINLEAVELEMEEAKIRKELLLTKLDNLYELLLKKYNINLKEYSLKNISNSDKNIEQYLKNYKIDDITKEKLNLEMLKQSESYSKYESYMPDLVLSFERIDKNRGNDNYSKAQNIISLRFSKKLFSTDTDYKIAKLERKKAQIELENLITNIENKKLLLRNEYQELKETAILSEKKLNIELKKYKIKEKEYELNKISYLDLIDAYTKYLNQEIESKKAQNEFNTFIYKVMLRG